MASIQQQLEAALREVLGPDVHLEEVETLSNGHLCGYVISQQFEDKDYADRRRLLRRALDMLTPDVQRQISTFLLMTEEEWSVDLKEQ